VCEVGVYKGGSLKLWQKLFPAGLVVGIDHDERSHWPPGTIRVVADQTDPRLPDLLAEQGLLAHRAWFDLIVDDASHDGDASRATFDLLWPLVAPGGWYVLEDWMTGFDTWPVAVERQPTMLATAQSFLHLFDRPDGDAEQVTYRYGQIILRKRTDAR